MVNVDKVPFVPSGHFSKKESGNSVITMKSWNPPPGYTMSTIEQILLTS